MVAAFRWRIAVGVLLALGMLVIAVVERHGRHRANAEPPRHTNHLIHEVSPYLLQHAHNPVDWHPWGEAAFWKARQEDKPIFLSIGYSTCHWCHVMERESFEDEEVAALLNRTFVCIKVDREERPDLDHLYMTVCQMLTGSGGWPLTVILTPDKKPFYAGTYFPKTGRFGRPGLMELVPAIAKAWRDERADVARTAQAITSHLQQTNHASPGAALTEKTLGAAHADLVRRYDSRQGGFDAAPKFPTPHRLLLLLRRWSRPGDGAALAMVEKTLSAMRRGGIYDHIGYGFHRYATDERWLVPHFEKMLYDQALLVMVYLEAYQATGRGEYARTAREVLAYVMRDMTSPEGGFYAAEDADSEGEEGRFYIWTPEEVTAVLGKQESVFFCQVFDIKQGGNYGEESSGRTTGHSIPHLGDPLSVMAGKHHMTEDALRQRLERARDRLFHAREKRIHPQKDSKVLTDWNGLMIAALARAAQVLEDPTYANAARRAADFVLSTLRDRNGRLLKRYAGGKAGLPAHVDDYAFLVWGLLDLYEGTFEVRYLKEAIALNRVMLTHFWDHENGGLFLTADDGEALLARSKQVYDGAIPSGNSVAALNLLRLARITGDAEHERQAQAIFKAFAREVIEQPSEHTFLLLALDFAIGPSFEVVIAGKPGAPDTRAMLRALGRAFAPRKVVLFRPDGDERPTITAIAPFTQTQTSSHGVATAYVCRGFACQAPTTDIGEILRSLKEPSTTPSR